MLKKSNSNINTIPNKKNGKVNNCDRLNELQVTEKIRQKKT